MLKLRSLLPFACAALALSAGTAAHGQGEIEPESSSAVIGSLPAGTEEILSAVNDCDASIGLNRVDIDVMLSRGWQIGGKENGELELGIKTTTIMLGKSGGQVINMVQIVGGLTVSCRTVAMISSKAQFSAIRSSLIETFELQPADQSEIDRSDTLFIDTVDEEEHANVLLSASRRLYLSALENSNDQTILIVNSPKRTD